MNKQTLDILTQALHYLHVGELREHAINLGLPHNGDKKALIARIVYFVTTGKIQSLPTIPQISRAQKNKTYPLAPETLILKGAYKNDLATRIFFKSIIGEHFHFTAFGIDWINERWFAGNPPTYTEFASMWQNEYERRKTNPEPPKKEWAYINFVQDYIKQFPDASRETIMDAWKEKLAHQRKIASDILENYAA